MKTEILLAWVSLWATAAASAARGGPERALFYSVYIMEELGYTDTSQMTIAADCVGTRMGLRGQPNRCRLNEFLDHIWMPEPNNDKTSRPPPDRVAFPNAAVKGDDPALFSSNKKTATWITTAKLGPEVSTGTEYTDWKKGTKLPGAGYWGLIEETKLFPSAGDYYDALKLAGRSYWNAAQSFEADGRLDEAAKTPLRNYKGRAVNAITLANNFRVQDAGAYEIDLVRKAFHEVYDTADSSVTKTLLPYTSTPETKVGEIWQLNEAQTATDYANRVGSTPARMQQLITGWIAANAASPEGQAHQKALVAAKQALDYARTGRC
ncbi:hypothetical protein BJX65DRAFT_315411 [Aspergillus insuetus]